MAQPARKRSTPQAEASVSNCIAKFMMASCVFRSAIAACDHEGFAGNPRGIRGSQEHRCRGNVFRLTDAPQRSLSLDLLAEIAHDDSGRMRAFCLHHAGVDCVDANLARTKF